MAAPTITWSETNEGGAISEPLDHGIKENGQTTDVKNIYIRHDATNQLSNCKFWIGEYSGTYSGGASAAADLAELLGWGDAASADDFGGCFLQMDAQGGFPTWPTLGDKNATTYGVFRSGVGDDPSTGITLSQYMSTVMTQDGVIPGDGSHDPNPRFQMKVQIPTNESTAGVRQFDQKLRFTYTS